MYAYICLIYVYKCHIFMSTSLIYTCISLIYAERCFICLKKLEEILMIYTIRLYSLRYLFIK